MIEFYARTGKMALGSRLRRLSDQITEQAAGIYKLYQVDLQPKWFPVFYALSEGGEKSITDIAREIGHSHPSVSQIVREMSTKGYVKEKKGKEDGRKNFVILSAKGRELRDRMEPQIRDVQAAIEAAFGETDHDLWRAIGEWEFLLEQKNLIRRVLEIKKRRECETIKIVDYIPAYKLAFKQLNEEWISHYFKMEAVDHQSLDHPQEYILESGGYIAMALFEGKPVGTCALIAMGARIYELAKMAVSPKLQGKGIGRLLGLACIDKAKELGAHTIYLESNTRLKPAISLYQQLGFRKTTGHPSPYERCNIQMELSLV